MRRWIENRFVRACLTAAVYLLVWQAAAAAVARPLLLPGPALTLRRLFALLGEPESYAAIALTLPTDVGSASKSTCSMALAA